MIARRLTTVLVAAVLLTASGTSLAAVTGSPDITASLSDSTVVPGEEATFDVVLTNTGSLDTASSRNPGFNSEVTTARGLRVDIKDGDGPFTITTDEQVYGSFPQGTTEPLSFAVVVDENAEPGTYRLPVVLEYKYTEFISETSGDRDEATETTREMVTVTVADRPTFAITDVDSNVRVDSTGTVEVTVENTGSETAYDAAIGFESSSPDLSVGGQQASSRYVSAWGPGETRTFQYRIGSAPNANADTYEFGVTVDFEDTDGVRRQSVEQSVGVPVAPAQSFSVVDTENDVTIGDDGSYDITLRNEGPVAVTDATVQISSQSSDISFGDATSTTQYVGSWQPGETRTVSVRATADSNSDRQSYALSAQVRYEDPEETVRRPTPCLSG
ncbi:COG1361 S-layer family protein [Halomicroarcula sp. GCM10025709]|uniref:COG1361 S-layer family protein n=1 Tax=Halomicroarcula sp. GCM10025709 TaxID=3252669 RepID=UPI003620C383